MANFKKGDRVAVYGYYRDLGNMKAVNCYFSGGMFESPRRGEVDSCPYDDGSVVVFLDNGVRASCHVYQLRKLRRKK